jgi:hypothetical protein
MTTPDSFLETRYCGTMKFEVAFQGISDNEQEWFYKIKAKFGTAPIFREEEVVIKADTFNPKGKEVITRACNQFIANLEGDLSRAGQGEIPVQMSAEIVRVQVFNILCQNVEGILQPDQPKYLITEREI